ncbi:T9SS type B sorting domain-containing protein [Maribacter sp. 2307ULW6-5]|uniref:T9SS type B sorting domain-containing protein n=1 Tax=Maribacter sp. 2307ULW6-5 TaxID=3386275 RepID=UPI0039BC7159
MAQLGFCQGNSGDPIFTEDFGAGPNIGPALPAGTTTYVFTRGTPGAGQYTINNNTDYLDWFEVEDHTPGDVNGKMLIVNASFTADEFYRVQVDNLCENTSYEFSAWLMNILPAAGCGGNAIPVNVRFEIWDENDTQRLAFGDTGRIPGSTSPNWEQYGVLFETLPGQTSIILKMRNNANGGCGNDLAIDDIVFKSCGDIVTVADENNQDSLTVCASEGNISANLVATPDLSIFSSHNYQWQESTDRTNWTDIPGATNPTLTTTAITETTYYRTKVAQDAVNLNNDRCNVVSDVFTLEVVPIPPAPAANGNEAACEGDTARLRATVRAGETVNWYDAPTGGNLLLANSDVFETEQAGTYYAETITEAVACPSASRTPVTLTINPLPQVGPPIQDFLCEGTTVDLSAPPNATSYQWSTGEIAQTIAVGAPGEYTVTITNANNCSAVQTYVVEELERPVLGEIRSNGPLIEVGTTNTGDFEYALDSGNFQETPTFGPLPSGRYTLRVRERNGCGNVAQEHVHIVVPQFFTPNGDGNNDLFSIDASALQGASTLAIYDRYGKLLKFGTDGRLEWNGEFQGRQMPAGNYWYVLETPDFTRKGPLLLKR